MLHPLQLLQPTTVEEGSKALAEFGERARIYAGGAELLLLLRNGLLESEILVDVKKIARLHCLTANQGSLHVGACVTHYQLQNHPLIARHAPALAYAESQVANVRVRNQGTLGGNLAFNDPHSDPATVLLVHDAWVKLGSQSGERKLAVSEFFVDMYATALQESELLVEVEIPFLPSGMTSAYQRLHRYQRPTLGVAAAARLDKGILEDVRLAVGCVGPKAMRLSNLESKLKGCRVPEAKRVIAEEKNQLRQLLRPVDDLLGSADYKLYMTGIMLGDALEQAVNGDGSR